MDKKIRWAQFRMIALEAQQYGQTFIMSITYRNAFPRFSISKVTEDGTSTNVTLPITPVFLEYVVDMIKTAANSDNGYVEEVTTSNNVYVDGNRTNEIRVNGKVRVSKENDNVVIAIKFTHADTDDRLKRLGVKPTNREIEFRFPIQNHKYFGIGNDQQSKTRYAMAYAEVLSGLNKSYLASFSDTESREQ